VDGETKEQPDERERLQTDEEQSLREQVRRQLESTHSGDTPKAGAHRGADTTPERRNERLRVIHEEEDAFYAKLGLQRHLNHRGQYEWLTAEQIERRRRSGRGGQRRSKHKRPWYRRLGKYSKLNVVSWLTVVVFLGIVVIVDRIADAPSYNYEIEVHSVPEGAAVYIDGQPTNRATNARIDLMEGGVRVVTVSMPGYRAMPSEKSVELTRDDLVSVAFTLYRQATDSTIESTSPR